MAENNRSLWIAGLGALLLCAGYGAQAQDPASNSSGNSSGNSAAPVIGPPQLKDFRLEPRERIVTQPAPEPLQPTQQAQTPAETRTEPRAAPSTAAPAARRAAETPRQEDDRPASAARQASPPQAQPTILPGFDSAFPQPDSGQAPPAVTDAPAAQQSDGWQTWLFALPIAALALVGVAALRRRRRARETEVELAPAPAAAAPPRPRHDPLPRPWLELELKAERATATPDETVVHFELIIRNTGKTAARNLRIDVKMFNAGREQDKEIGAFFRTAGRESTKLKIPGIAGESQGVINGEVAMPRAEMRAVRLDDRMLFIPVVAVNALYDWGEGRTGQTSKSYVVGRELEQSSEKMGAFRVDQGPRIWRTVGQRPHKLARRV